MWGSPLHTFLSPKAPRLSSATQLAAHQRWGCPYRGDSFKQNVEQSAGKWCLSFPVPDWILHYMCDLTAALVFLYLSMRTVVATKQEVHAPQVPGMLSGWNYYTLYTLPLKCWNSRFESGHALACNLYILVPYTVGMWARTDLHLEARNHLVDFLYLFRRRQSNPCQWERF